MKTIFAAVILSIFYLSASAGPKQKHAPNRNPNSVNSNDDRYVCKNSQSRLTYVANRTSGIISMYEPDGDDKDHLPDRVRKMENLKVVEESKTDGENGKEIVSYTFFKKIETLGRGTILRPVFELEMEKGNGTSEIQHAEAKIMDVKITDENDFDVNLNCKSSKAE